MRTNDQGLFWALENALKVAEHPLDCHDLFAIDEVQLHATNYQRVSDYLGNMWRKNLLIRMPAPKDTKKSCRTRYVYQWRGENVPNIHQHAMEYTPRVFVDKPSVLISEEGNVITLEFPNLLISIRQKQGK
jgi:hypothetical protein